MVTVIVAVFGYAYHLVEDGLLMRRGFEFDTVRRQDNFIRRLGTYVSVPTCTWHSRFIGVHLVAEVVPPTLNWFAVVNIFRPSITTSRRLTAPHYFSY